ncbi:MAG: type II toxin-antitoxin system VapB family antitoxin [Verrucomicrobiaceae bacterium]|nr:MAG: type II toxin-antitoxin system VapB family antitoxin [Verrucomicrobiaceae bacterium]
MRTNIDIDDDLMADAMRELGAKTKREAVESALRTALRIRRQAGMRALRGMAGAQDFSVHTTGFDSCEAQQWSASEKERRTPGEFPAAANL